MGSLCQHASQQPHSPIGFLLYLGNFRYRLVRYYWYHYHDYRDMFRVGLQANGMAHMISTSEASTPSSGNGGDAWRHGLAKLSKTCSNWQNGWNQWCFLPENGDRKPSISWWEWERMESPALWSRGYHPSGLGDPLQGCIKQHMKHMHAMLPAWSYLVRLKSPS